MYQTVTVNIKGPIQRRKLGGRDHIVAPAVLMMEGVYAGSDGPLFYSADQLEKACPAWNNKPIVRNHPKDGDRFVSAADPSILDEFGVGLLLNTRWEDSKQKTECWFDEERARRIIPQELAKIEKGQKVELSTGLVVDGMTVNEAEHGGHKYTVEATNHRPDHLAILTDAEGACSCKRGCGVLANSGQMSHDEMHRKLHRALAERMGSPGQEWNGYIHEVYPDHAIFSHAGEMWKHEYKTQGDDVKLHGKPRKVRREVSYVPVTNEKPQETVNVDKKAKIDALIANGVYKAEQRAKLEGMDDEILAAIPLPAKPDTPTPVTLQGLIDNASPELKQQFSQIKLLAEKKLADDAAAKDGAIKTILANNQDGWNEEFLKTQPLELLQGMARMAARAGHAVSSDNSPSLPPMFVGNTGGFAPVDNAPVPEATLPYPSLDLYPLPGTTKAG